MNDYELFLYGLRLRYFAPVEITSYGRRTKGGAQNGLPPIDLWDNLVPTLWVLDQLRHALGKPITLTSIYRNQAYNAAVGGAALSQHKYNAACDFQVAGMTPREAFNALVGMRAAGSFLGGLGLYSTFVHIDTRGTNATWGT